MKLNDFYLSAIPEPVTLLGLRLRPFSLGHNLLLHRIESAFICGGPISYDDLAASVFICAQPYSQGLASFTDPDRPRFMRAWHRKLTGDCWWRRLLRLKVTPVDLRAKAAEFTKYIEDGSKMPYYTMPADEAGGSEIEGIQAVQLALMSKTTLTEAEIMDRPWGRCLFDYVALQAMDGRVTIRDKGPIDEARAIGEAIAAKLAQRNIRPVNGENSHG